MGSIREPRPVAYTRAMSEHRCFPKTRLSTHTMHFKWHHRNRSKMTMRHWKRIMNEDTHLLLMWKEKSLYRCIKLTRRWNMISPVIFAWALTIFAGAMPPWAPPWWRGRFVSSLCDVLREYEKGKWGSRARSAMWIGLVHIQGVVICKPC